MKYCLFFCSVVILGIQLQTTQAAVAGSQLSSDPELSIVAGEKSLVFKRSELLKSKDLTSVTVQDDPFLPQDNTQRTYEAIPFKALLKGIVIDPKLAIYFQCEDGFSAAIPTKLLLNEHPKQAIPYVAIESPQQKWPSLKAFGKVFGSKKTAGPFYLIWKNAQASHIPIEYWPYQVVKFELKEDPLRLYPHLLPDPQLPETHRVRKGLRAFLTNCFQCHTLNKEGSSQLGPDLNVPMNPTEYLKPKALRMQIRNPGGLRYWPLSKMHGFPPAILSEDELEDIVTYLEHMAKRKVAQ